MDVEGKPVKGDGLRRLLSTDLLTGEPGEDRIIWNKPNYKLGITVVLVSWALIALFIIGWVVAQVVFGLGVHEPGSCLQVDLADVEILEGHSERAQLTLHYVYVNDTGVSRPEVELRLNDDACTIYSGWDGSLARNAHIEGDCVFEDVLLVQGEEAADLRAKVSGCEDVWSLHVTEDAHAKLVEPS